MATVTVNDLLQGHVGLDIECLDRIYFNGYVPTLQYGGHVSSFMSEHLGLPIPWPAVMEKIGTRFRRWVADFAPRHQIPLVRFAKADRKQDVMRPCLAQQARTGQPGVAAIGMAQEFQNVFASTELAGSGSPDRVGSLIKLKIHETPGARPGSALMIRARSPQARTSRTVSASHLTVKCLPSVVRRGL